MDGQTGWGPRALALTALLALSVPAGAGPLGKHEPGCPPASYSPLHYWAPNLYRLRAWFHAPAAYHYPPARYPHIAPQFEILTYPCPAEEPATIYGQRYWSRGLLRRPQAPTVRRTFSPQPRSRRHRTCTASARSSC